MLGGIKDAIGVTPFLLPTDQAGATVFQHEGCGGPPKARSAPIVENSRCLLLFPLVAASSRWETMTAEGQWLNRSLFT